jgi:hypothetical protein
VNWRRVAWVSGCPGWLNGVWWRLTFLGPECETCFNSSCWCLEIWSGSWIFGKFGYPHHKTLVYSVSEVKYWLELEISICVIKTNLMHYLSPVYFVNQPLLVLDTFVANHQEVYCIYTAIGMCCALQLTVCWPGTDSQLKSTTHTNILYIYSIPPDDWLQICPKHVEVDRWNKLRISSALSWFLLHRYIKMDGQQNIKFEISTFKPTLCYFEFIFIVTVIITPLKGRRVQMNLCLYFPYLGPGVA